MHPNSKNKPGGLYFSKTIVEGLIYGQGKLASPNRLGYRFCVVLLCVLRGIFLVQATRVGGGEEGAYLYIWKGDLMEGFFALLLWRAYIWRGLYMDGFIFGILRYSLTCKYMYM